MANSCHEAMGRRSVMKAGYVLFGAPARLFAKWSSGMKREKCPEQYDNSCHQTMGRWSVRGAGLVSFGAPERSFANPSSRCEKGKNCLRSLTTGAIRRWEGDQSWSRGLFYFGHLRIFLRNELRDVKGGNCLKSLKNSCREAVGRRQS